MKLTYWCAECEDDSHAYSVRAKTKREALAILATKGGKFGPLHKVTVEYRDAFDLLTACLDEGGACWEVAPEAMYEARKLEQEESDRARDEADAQEQAWEQRHPVDAPRADR